MAQTRVLPLAAGLWRAGPQRPRDVGGDHRRLCTRVPVRRRDGGVDGRDDTVRVRQRDAGGRGARVGRDPRGEPLLQRGHVLDARIRGHPAGQSRSAGAGEHRVAARGVVDGVSGVRARAADDVVSRYWVSSFFSQPISAGT